MKTLEEISNMNPSQYKVIDSVVSKCVYCKSNSDKIEIVINGKSKFCTRSNGAKFGLCEKS